MNLFYSPDIEKGFFTLESAESKHVVKVLRKTAGDTLRFTDGKGFFYDCRIDAADPRACGLEVTGKYPGDDRRDFYLHIAVAPTKNINRFEWFLEKSTEIGIDRITPFISHHSERKVIKKERLEKVLVSAMKQSLKSRLPQLDDLMSFDEVLQLSGKMNTYIAYVDDGLESELSKIYTKGSDALILIGPEGDFDPDEIKKAREKGFKAVKLGPSRLRTETAAIVACHTINLLNLQLA
jgi:16S rRNA (uracil1498-N3)-methyltransferase